MMILKRIAYVLAGLVVAAGCVWVAFVLSPWPSVLLIRHAFSTGATGNNVIPAELAPAGVTAIKDVSYGPRAAQLLDIYFPEDAAGRKLPTIVWVHGGGFIGGTRSEIAGYMEILAGHGYAVVAIDYSLAPGARYPTPVIESNQALAFLAGQVGRYPFDMDRLFLAGDSAGAQIAAQLAATISDQAYAADVGVAPAVQRSQLAGAILFCGIFDATRISMKGPFANFLRTVVWSYFGTKDIADNPLVGQFSVNRHVTPDFPPALISAGNADPLGPQSRALTDALKAQGVEVETLFFAEDHQPALPHEFRSQAGGQQADARKAGGFPQPPSGQVAAINSSQCGDIARAASAECCAR
jgi:acetyl esterase/lipase